jgi:CRISPR-associated protein Csd1
MAIEPWPTHFRDISLKLFASRAGPAVRDSSGKVFFNPDTVPSRTLSELLRAVLTGVRLPRSLLATLVMRVRRDGELDAMRVSLIKAIIIRDRRLTETTQEDFLVRYDPNDTNPARRLGQLFAVIERAQRSALGDEISATVVEQYLGAAAATPARIMRRLVIAAQTRHIARLKRGRSDSIWIRESGNPTELAKRVGFRIERDIARILSKFDDGIPTQLSVEEQGLFLIGYYQERWGDGRGKLAAVADSAADAGEDQDL